ncbi:hypothetical protein GCM10010873_11670 [Cypionkella aquatica]|uniref:DUF1109 domain-containing protein n=1 Tax=Cypionkella aquatica TaxID=1756042 RepID=A0AA37WZ87_9RHOB|nr:DUF1109 domain-containing protein [Cypionkella aquatica]GLS86193.1 hypothetical protein GCM10010873_11670 [Cypionkella aquatica]
MSKTDDLIIQLSGSPVRAPLRQRRLAAIATLAMLVPVALFLAEFGMRRGLMSAWSNPVVILKTLLPLGICGLSLVLLLRLIRPEARIGRAGYGYAAPVAVALLLWAGAFISRAPQARFAEVGTFSLTECLGSILMLSIVPLVGLLMLARQGASTAPQLSGALVGLTAASGVTAGYSLFCTRDNPLFFVTWYGVAILIVTVVGAIVGRRVLQW